MDREELLKILAEGNGLKPIKAVMRNLRKDESLTELVLEEALNPESPQGRNAAWTVEYLTRRKRRTINPHMDKIIAAIPAVHDARQQARLLHMLTHFRLSPRQLGPLLNHLIECLRKVDEVNYLAYYSMQLLRKVVKKEPYFAREFKLAVTEALPLYDKYYLTRMAGLLISDCDKAMIELGEDPDQTGNLSW
jgi:hypothetical protein